MLKKNSVLAGISLFCACLVLLACLVVLAGCAVTGGVGNAPIANPGNIPQVQHVAVVVLENANYSDVIGSGSMPYLNSLLSKGAIANQYFANSHPSIPNYFTMTTGEPVTNDDSFSGTVSIDNVVRELNASGKTWKAYVESLPSPGYLGGDQGLYLQHHNPFAFFSDVQQSTSQAANIVPFSQVTADLGSGALPNYSFIVPNELDDAHSCTDGSTTDCPLAGRLQTADQWLQNNVGPLLASSAFQQSGLLIITFDESATDLTNGGGRVATVLVGASVKPGYAGNTTSYDHRSLLSLTLRTLGVTGIPNGADAAPQMSEFFQ